MSLRISWWPINPPCKGMEGKPARWSGVISAVHNKADQSVIEVVYLPLKSNGVPEQTEQSPGRFLAIMQGFVDPTLYAKGRSLTVLGTLDKPVDSQIGEHKYRFSVLKVTGSKLWPPVKEVEIRYMDPYFTILSMIPSGPDGPCAAEEPG